MQNKIRKNPLLFLASHALKNWAIALGVTPWGPKYAQEPWKGSDLPHWICLPFFWYVLFFCTIGTFLSCCSKYPDTYIFTPELFDTIYSTKNISIILYRSLNILTLQCSGFLLKHWSVVEFQVFIHYNFKTALAPSYLKRRLDDNVSRSWFFLRMWLPNHVNHSQSQISISLQLRSNFLRLDYAYFLQFHLVNFDINWVQNFKIVKGSPHTYTNVRH